MNCQRHFQKAWCRCGTGPSRVGGQCRPGAPWINRERRAARADV